MAQDDQLKKLISHCKEYGFIFPSSDIKNRKATNVPFLYTFHMLEI